MPEKALVYKARWEKDPITSFEVDVEEDIPGELEAFIRLNRLGRFSEARAFFEETLRPHVDQFPVFIEYADLLLEQGSFSRLSEFLGSAPKNLFTSEEIVLVDLFKALTDIYVDAAWQSGLDQAQLAWEFLHDQSLGSDGLPSDVQIHIIELYLAINVLKNDKSGLAEESTERLDFPWKPWSEKNVYQWTRWTSFIDWYETLRERGLSWEANKILRILLPSLNIDQVWILIRPEQLSSTVKSVDGLKASEPVLLTVLTVANDILRYALASFHKYGIVGTRGLLEFVAPYYEVASTVVEIMFGPEPDVSQGRPVVLWKLAGEQMTYLKNAGMVDHFELHPLFIRLEIAAISLEDIRLQAELILAVCWTDPESDNTSSTPPVDASPIIEAGWDLTLLDAPLYSFMIPRSDAGLEILKKILRHRRQGWQMAQLEVWNLLLVTANDDQRYELLLNLTKILAEDGPRTLNDSPALQLAFLLLAQSPDLVFHNTYKYSSIFHKAAQLGVMPILEAALNAERSRVEEFLSTRDFRGNTPLDYAVENKQEAVIAKLLSLGYKMPITKDNLYELARYADPNIVKMMGMLLQENTGIYDIREAIERDRSDVARVLLQIYYLQSPDTGEWQKLLPLAVQRRQTDVMEILVSKFPEAALNLDKKGRSVLWYNKPSSDEEDPQIQQIIRDRIAPIIIRKAPITEAKRILGQGARELCLDLSIYKDSPEGLSRLVDSISQTLDLQFSDPKYNRPSFDIEFESMLKYVHIPISDSGDDPNTTHKVNGPRDDVNKILHWLSRRKGVKKILELRVIDSERQPHVEEKIADAVRELDVEILNWYRPDLSIDCILEAAPNVEELHLYSCNWTSLSQWTSEEGAIVLPKLRVLHITILMASIGETVANRYRKKAEERLTQLLSHSENTIQWDIKLSRDLDESRSPLEVTRLGPFLKGYKSLQYGKPLASKSTCTRIAILDDGVDQVSPVWAEINKRGQRAAITGASFVVDNDGNESPWWLSHTAHGTQLAGVILEMDPFCELFIAKVMLRRDEVDLGRVISAIKWAIGEKVDMIVLDLDLPEPADGLGIDNFRQILYEAHRDGITFIKNAGNSVWLYDIPYGDIITVANKTSSNTRITYRKETPEIFCDGNSVTVPGFTSENQDQKLPASSAATAIAVGVVSLILATLRLMQSNDDDYRTQKISFELLNGIMRREMDGGKSLQPWKFFGEHTMHTKEMLRATLSPRISSLSDWGQIRQGI